MMKKLLPTIAVLSGPRATVAALNVEIDGEYVTFTGDAKRHPRDRQAQEIGEYYAIGRALQAAANEFLVTADTLVSVMNGDR